VCRGFARDDGFGVHFGRYQLSLSTSVWTWIERLSRDARARDLYSGQLKFWEIMPSVLLL
jgi:hypothetical protein